MKRPVIYIYTEEAHTMLLACPRFVDAIIRDHDEFKAASDPELRPLTAAEIWALYAQNEAFTIRLQQLLAACRKFRHASVIERGDVIRDINQLMEHFEGL